MELILVTGNKNKLIEFQAILHDIDLKNEKIDLDEIQSLDLEEITKHKAKQAYQLLKKPVIVEDTGFFLDEFKGLPGSFIKFFNQQLGNESMIKMLGNCENRKAYAKTCVTYYDGEKFIFAFGKVDGNVTKKLSQGEGFGFDYCFIPNGYDKTLSELGLDIKNKISHRRRAIDDLKQKLPKR